MFLNFLKPIFIILEVIVIFNLMIIVHELGHFLAARWRGMHIEKFGIWFGKPIWKKKVNGVEYSLGWIPAGGFVSLPQLAAMEVMEGKTETPRDQMPPVSAMDKIIVAFAGPLFSFLLAVTFAVIVWQVGRPVGDAESTTIVGEVGPKTPAADAGMQAGDKILSVDGHKVTRFGGMGADSVTWRIIRSEGDTVAIEIERGTEVKTIYPKPVVPDKVSWYNRKGLRMIGISPKISAVVGKVAPDSIGATAGLQVGDVVTEVNGKEIFDSNDIYRQVDLAEDGQVHLTVDRKGQSVPVLFRPATVKVVSVQEPGLLARLFGAKADSPAALAGLKKDDVILAMDGQPVTTVPKLIKAISSKDGTPVSLHIRRGTGELDLTVTPQMVDLGEGEKRAMIGFVPSQNDGVEFLPMGKYKIRKPTPGEQIMGGVMSILNTLDAVSSRKSSVSVQHMGGPVMMMNAYYTILSGPEGIRMALWFSVVLNVNLGLLNLLPIPPLDGSHITLAVIEGVRRKPVHGRVLEYVQSACTLMIIGFMAFIFFFDVQDLPFMGSKQAVQFKKPAPAGAAEPQK